METITTADKGYIYPLQILEQSDESRKSYYVHNFQNRYFWKNAFEVSERIFSICKLCIRTLLSICNASSVQLTF